MTREYPERPIVGVGAVVLSDDKVLMVRRGKAPGKGHWSLPGGAQKLGETVFETAKREILEETGLTIEVLGLIDVVDSIRPDGKDEEKIQYHYTLVDVVAVVADTESDEPVAGGDAEEAAWLPLSGIPGMDLWSETERIIGLAVEMHAALKPEI